MERVHLNDASFTCCQGICDILAVDKDLSKVVKTGQESSPVSLLPPWSTFILLVTHLILINMYFYSILTYGIMIRSKFVETPLKC